MNTIFLQSIKDLNKQVIVLVSSLTIVQIESKGAGIKCHRRSRPIHTHLFVVGLSTKVLDERQKLMIVPLAFG